MEKKLQKLKSILSDMQSVLIAFSGGVDSSFLTKIAFKKVPIFFSPACRGKKMIALWGGGTRFSKSKSKNKGFVHIKANTNAIDNHHPPIQH